MIVFQSGPVCHKVVLEQRRDVVARRHSFDPKDDKATPEWDTIDNVKELDQFSLALKLILGLIGALTVGVWAEWA